MIGEYIRVAMKQAKYEVLEDGTFYGEITELKGVWSNAETLEDCREELEEVLEEWLLLRLSKHLPIPTISGVSLKAPTVA